MTNDALRLRRDETTATRLALWELSPLAHPPEVSELGNTISQPGGPAGIMAYVNHAVSGVTHTERWVLFDKDHFTGALVFRIRKCENADYDQPWAEVVALIDPEEVEGFIEMSFQYVAPPATSTDTGETGTFHTFVLENQKTGVTPYVCGCLLRIEHSNGTWTDHWALFEGYEPPDGEWKVQGTPQGSEDDWYFTSVGAFYEEMLSRSDWQHSPRKGWHVWVPGFTIEPELP
jgi:hypothetical protein